MLTEADGKLYDQLVKWYVEVSGGVSLSLMPNNADWITLLSLSSANQDPDYVYNLFEYAAKIGRRIHPLYLNDEAFRYPDTVELAGDTPFIYIVPFIKVVTAYHITAALAPTHFDKMHVYPGTSVTWYMYSSFDRACRAIIKR
jgi:hypothetical protein